MARATVEGEDDRFDLGRQQIDSGSAVVWQRVGSTPHVVDSIQFCATVAEWQFRTQTLRSGDGAVYTLGEEGIYEHYCGPQGEDTCGVVRMGDVSLAKVLPSSDETPGFSLDHS